MEQTVNQSIGIKHKLISTLLFAKQILLNPAVLFRNMERQGGFTEPLIFMASIGFIAGLLKIFVTFVYMANGAIVTLTSALLAVVITPLSVICLGYISAFLLATLMRQLGCDGQVETAFRVVSYLCVISPLSVVLSPIPLVGNILVLGILTYLIIPAAIEVYQLNSNTAWMIFGIGLTVIAIAALGSEYMTRKSSPTIATTEHTMTAPLQTTNH